MNSSLYKTLEWVTRFAYINLLWIFFTIIGGVLLGFFPATTAMFAIIRDWLQGNNEDPLLTGFWKYYKKDFWKSNRLGAFIVLIVAFITIDIFFISTNLNEVLTWTYIPLFAFMFLFTLFLFYIFPAFVNYDLTVIQLIKNSFLIMLVNPLNSFIIIICLISCYYIMKLLPALAFLFGGSIYAFITMWLALYAFDNVQNKQKGNK